MWHAYASIRFSLCASEQFFLDMYSLTSSGLVALQFLLRCRSSLATLAIVLSWYAFRFIQSIVLTIFIFDWDAVLCTGDDVAVPV